MTAKKHRISILEERNRISLFHLREMAVSTHDPELAGDLNVIIEILEGATDDLLGVRGSVSMGSSNKGQPNEGIEPSGPCWSRTGKVKGGYVSVHSKPSGHSAIPENRPKLSIVK